jgi:hypothetical protein
VPILKGAAGLSETVAELTRELNEALERQTGTSQILGAISRSKFQLQPILQSVVETAARLCRAEQAQIFRREDGVYRHAVFHGFHDPVRPFDVALGKSHAYLSFPSPSYTA